MRSTLLAAALLLATASTALAAPRVEAVKPWSRPAVAGGTAAGFVTLVNHGTTADALVAVETPAAKRAELHRSSMEGGVMRMTPVDRVPVAPGATVNLAPGGFHIMLIGLKAGLKAGDSASATLVFASGARVQTRFVVGMAPPAGAAAPMDHGHMHR